VPCVYCAIIEGCFPRLGFFLTKCSFLSFPYSDYLFMLVSSGFFFWVIFALSYQQHCIYFPPTGTFITFGYSPYLSNGSSFVFPSFRFSLHVTATLRDLRVFTSKTTDILYLIFFPNTISFQCTGRAGGDCQFFYMLHDPCVIRI